MLATIIVADAARAHPDGTFSLLRGGIDRLNVPRDRQKVFRGSIVVRFTADPQESGPHAFHLVFTGPTGDVIGKEIEGQFQIPEHGGSVQAVMEFQQSLPDYGRYRFTVSADREPLADWTVDVIEAEG